MTNCVGISARFVTRLTKRVAETSRVKKRVGVTKRIGETKPVEVTKCVGETKPVAVTKRVGDKACRNKSVVYIFVTFLCYCLGIFAVISLFFLHLCLSLCFNFNFNVYHLSNLCFGDLLTFPSLSQSLSTSQFPKTSVN